MTVIVNIPLKLTEAISVMSNIPDVYNMGVRASEELIKNIQFVEGSRIVFELVPPAFDLPEAFFNGLFGELIHLLGPGLLQGVSMRCVHTKKSHPGQYGLDRYKQIMNNETPTYSIRTIADQEVHQGRLCESAPLRVQGN